MQKDKNKELFPGTLDALNDIKIDVNDVKYATYEDAYVWFVENCHREPNADDTEEYMEMFDARWHDWLDNNWIGPQKQKNS